MIEMCVQTIEGCKHAGRFCMLRIGIRRKKERMNKMLVALSIDRNVIKLNGTLV